MYLACSVLIVIGLVIILRAWPIVFFNNLKFDSISGTIEFTSHPYSAFESASSIQWRSHASVKVNNSDKTKIINVFPVIADNIFSTQDQLRQSVRNSLDQSEITATMFRHKTFFWITFIFPSISKKAHKESFIHIILGALVFTIGCVLTMFV